MKCGWLPVVSVISLVMVGCASTRPHYANKQEPNSAVVQGTWADYMEYNVENQAQVTILEVDGVEVKRSFFSAGPGNTVYLSPGKHKLTILAEQCKASLPVRVKAGKTYKIKGKRTAFCCALQLYDETKPPSKMVWVALVGPEGSALARAPVMVPKQG